MEIRFHLDECVDNAVADGLRRRGIDVTTTTDADLVKASDERHLEFSRSEGRFVFTHDADYIRLNHEDVPHVGIVYCHQSHRTIGQMVLGLVDLWRHNAAEEMVGQVQFL